MSGGDTREPRRIRDVDSAARALRIKALAFALLGCIPFLIIALYVAAGTTSPRLVATIILLSAFSVMYFGTLYVGEWLGRGAGSIYFSGGSSSARREYSLADSLIARGRFDDAIEELERAAAQYAGDPEPALRLARLLRDRKRPEDAIVWYRTALARSTDAGVEIAATREIIEIHTHVLREPTRALPHLARLASRHADSPAGTWARREMADIRSAMKEEEQA